LYLDQGDVVGVDFRDQERNVVVESAVRGVR